MNGTNPLKGYLAIGGKSIEQNSPVVEWNYGNGSSIWPVPWVQNWFLSYKQCIVSNFSQNMTWMRYGCTQGNLRVICQIGTL